MRTALAAFWIAAGLDWLAAARDLRRLEYVAKPATLAILLAWAASRPDASPWLVAALVCSLAGDVFLMLPGDRFAPGLAAFLLAHLAYLVAFPSPWPARLGWLVVVLLGTSPVAVRIVRAAPAALRGAVVVYLTALAAMTASALATGDPLVSAGALLFLASDALLAWDRFVHAWPGAKLIVHATYHVGQLLLVVALAGA